MLRRGIVVAKCGHVKTGLTLEKNRRYNGELYNISLRLGSRVGKAVRWGGAGSDDGGVVMIFSMIPPFPNTSLMELVCEAMME